MKTITIKQGGMFPQSPHELYEIWLDSKKHAALTGDEAEISRKVKGLFFAFGGWATGVNMELVKDKKIVQTWRGDDWPEGVFSTITLKLLPAKGGTKLLFTQTGVPASKAKGVAQGWRDYYWTPLKKKANNK
ncbi:MAG: SRPBCC family protein [Patescibacteria group bacterium]